MLRRFAIWAVCAVAASSIVAGPAAATECVEVGQFKHCI